MLGLALMACGAGRDADPSAAQETGPRASIDELQQLKHTARSCEADAECPSGSHCDEDAGRCDWACFADSDCSEGQACGPRGECAAAAPASSASRTIAPSSASRTSTAAPRLGTISSQLVSTHPSCVALPLTEKLDALNQLAGNPAVCFDDQDCPCGSYCGNDATCRFECFYEAPAAPPFCTPGEVCSAEGRCVLPSGTDDPSLIVDLEVTPDIVRGDTAPGPVLVPVDVRVRAKLPAHVTAANNVTVGLEVVPRTGGPTPFMARVRCAAGAPLTSSCTLGAGWPFGGDPDPLRSAARPIWIELPQTTTADEWSVVVRSEWADAPVSLSALARPVVAPPVQVGHFVGTVRWPQLGGEPLVLAVEAQITATRVLLTDPSRLLLPEGHAVLAKEAAYTSGFAWLKADHPSQGPQSTVALLDVDTWVFTAATRSITSAMRLTLGSGPAPTPLTLELDYQGPTPNATCSSATCGAGKYCNTDIGLCVAGTNSPSWISLDGLVPSSLLYSSQRAEWVSASNGLRASNPAVFGGSDVIGYERAMCFANPAQGAAGRLSSSNGTLGGANPSGETTCLAGSSTLDFPQQIFPYANRTKGVETTGGVETFNLLDTCLEELNALPTTPYTAANLLQPKKCVSLARFMMALSTPRGTPGFYPQPAQQRLENQLMRQWVSLHALISRGAVQESEYDETVGGTLDQPMHQRLGTAVDVVEKAWRLVLKQKRNTSNLADAELAAAKAIDARTLGRPLAHWTLNQYLDGALPDTEGNHPLSLWNIPTDSRNLKYLSIGNNPWATCRTETQVALPTRHFSLGAWIGASGTSTAYDLISKYGADGLDLFRIHVYNSSSTQRRVEVQYLTRATPAATMTLASQVTFDVPAEPGYYVFVADGGKYRLQQLRRNPSTGAAIVVEHPPLSIFAAGPQWGTAGQVFIGCQTPQGLVLADELSLWDRPLPVETSLTYAMTFLSATGANQPAVDSLPPRQLAIAATDEAAQGLPVHFLDGLAAQMELLSAYVRAERSEMFLECGVSAVGPARTRVLDRVGRGLRFAALIEADAKDLVAMAGATATPWMSRYNAAARLLAGKRGEVVQQLDLATRCGNPLGITDDDLPLYHGTEAGESNRFFASSRFLTAQAKEQIDDAKNELNLARSAWQQQRASAFQSAVLAPAEKAERLRKLEQEYEGVLRKLCGVPTSGTILAAFRNGSMSSTNCFLKLDAPGCAGAATMTVKQLPSQCLRGELGEQILQIQAAELDLRNAENSYDRAIDQYNSEMEYCTRREDHHEETQAIQTKHRAHMIKLRAARRSAGMFGSFVKSMVGMAVGGLTGNPVLAISSWLDGAGLILGQPEVDAAEDEQDAESAHQLVMAARAAALDLMACFHGADNQKFAIDAARDIIDRAYHDTKGSVLRLQNQQSELRALVDQSIGDVDFENQMVRVLPHHHFWLDDHVDAYRRHFRYAQRLTYLALRAFEYESQQSLGLGNVILAARTPAVLEQAVLTLEQRTAPMQGEQGFVVGEFDPVMSLRDEILRLGTTEAPPGFPALSSIDSLRTFLKSDAARIYTNGEYVGRGIRFSLRPQPWAQFSCAERIWRITTALQVEGSPVNNARLLLWQENSFGSQRCRAAEHGELHISRIRPEHNLLVGEGGNFDGSPFVRPLRYTAMGTTGLGNKSREEMENLPEGAHSGFAGRGLYANYVLLFPSAQFDNPAFLSTVKDVLIRFDLVEVTDISGDPSP